MRTHQANLVLFVIDPEKSIEHADLLHFRLLRRIIQSAMPELLDNSSWSRAILNNIAFFIFRSPRMDSPVLEKQINEEPYLSLCGLKYMLRKTGSFAKLSLVMAERKQRLFNRLFEKSGLDA